MKLNLSLIADSLRDDYNILREESDHEELVLEHALIYTGETKFLPGRIYIAEGNKLPAKPFFDGICAIISIGPSNKCYIASKREYLELEEGIPIPEILNRIQEVHFKYRKWYMDMNDAIAHEEGVQALLDLTLPLLGNPIYLHDVNYHFIAHAEIPGMPGGKDIYDMEHNNGKFSLDDINILKSTPYFEKTFETKKPTFHIDTGECPYIYDNVWSNGKYWGRLFVDERVKPFKKGDYAIIEVLKNMIEKALFSRNLFPGKHYRFLEQKMIALLEGHSLDNVELNEELNSNNWSNFDKYFCFKLKMKEEDLLLNTIIRTCELIESKLPDSITFPYEDNIIGIVHVESRSATLENIRKILQEFKMYAGVSLLLSDFNEFPSYYKQAEIALKYGCKENKQELVHCFEDYCFSYMLDRCTRELSPEMLFPPALHKLMEHDKRKSTNYVETLRAYLENDLKPAKAMKVLFVQRSTFLYRLERIDEMIGIDFDDEKIKLHFMMAFQLMDRQKNKERK